MEQEKANKGEQQFKTVQSTKKSPFRKPKKVPVNYDDIDKWKMPEITPETFKGPILVEESSFATLFPKYREKYIRETFTFIQQALRQHGVKAELDLLEGSLTVKTTPKVIDPYVIIKARDIIKLVARSVPYQVALRLLDENTYCDIIKIKSLVENKEKFLKRRQRLIGPNGETLKALEILTECYIMVQGSTVSVIGHYKKMKIVRRIVEDTMRNIHPIYHIKQLMIKRELEKDEKLKNENWDRFLPQFQKVHEKRKKIKKEKEKRERATFPNPPQPRKEDLAIESGEYFLSDKDKQQRAAAVKADRIQQKQREKEDKRQAAYAQPTQTQRKYEQQQPASQTGGVDVAGLVRRFNVGQPPAL